MIEKIGSKYLPDSLICQILYVCYNGLKSQTNVSLILFQWKFNTKETIYEILNIC